MGQKQNKKNQRISSVEIKPAKNGFVVSYCLETKNSTGKNQYDSWNWLGRREEVFTKSQKDKAMERVLTLTEMAAESKAEGVDTYAPDDTEKEEEMDD